MKKQTTLPPDYLLKKRVRSFYEDYHQHRPREVDERMTGIYWQSFKGSVLEVGGGRRFPAMTLPGVLSYFSVDISSQAQQYAASQGVKCIVGDGEALPFADQQFDTVACCEVMEHMVRPDLFLHEMCRTSRHLIVEVGPNYLGSEWFPGYDRYIPLRLLKLLLGIQRRPHRLVPHLDYDVNWGPDKDAVSACNAWWVEKQIRNANFEILILDTWSFFGMQHFNQIPGLRYIGPYRVVVGRRKKS